MSASLSLEDLVLSIKMTDYRVSRLSQIIFLGTVSYEMEARLLFFHVHKYRGPIYEPFLNGYSVHV